MYADQHRDIITGNKQLYGNCASSKKMKNGNLHQLVYRHIYNAVCRGPKV